MMTALEGVVMELQDCSLPLLHGNECCLFVWVLIYYYNYGSLDGPNGNGTSNVGENIDSVEEISLQVFSIKFANSTNLSHNSCSTLE